MYIRAHRYTSICIRVHGSSTDYRCMCLAVALGGGPCLGRLICVLLPYRLRKSAIFLHSGDGNYCFVMCSAIAGYHFGPVDRLPYLSVPSLVSLLQQNYPCIRHAALLMNGCLVYHSYVHSNTQFRGHSCFPPGCLLRASAYNLLLNRMQNFGRL